MHRCWEEIIIITIRNRRSVWADNKWDADIEDMLNYTRKIYKEYWSYLDSEKVIEGRIINIIKQICKISETHFQRISKIMDKEYGPLPYA